MWAKSSTRYVRARAHAAEAGGTAVRTLTRGPPQAASRRRCRPCALAACGPRRPTPARCPPRPSFYRVVSRAAADAASRGARSADAGRRAAAAGPSLAAATLSIVGGGRRALPAALGPGGGAACARRGRTGRRRRAPSPAAGPSRKPGGARAGRRLSPGPAARAPIPLVAPFCLLGRARSPHGRPHSWPFVSRAPSFLGSCSRLRQVSAWRLLPPLLTLSEGGFGVGTFATSPLTSATSFVLKSRCAGLASVVEGLQCF